MRTVERLLYGVVLFVIAAAVTVALAALFGDPLFGSDSQESRFRSSWGRLISRVVNHPRQLLALALGTAAAAACDWWYCRVRKVKSPID